ncbi:arsenosugar biosynthesis radical SAM (seleno)protein ArsS [Adlercreutzia sp. ZJ304]|uniref:arsenosugar biosynthesis radical SAM (seleno)protein ArsS n=1 Tax=Adlercreutzia sp. ZJ304 TaxID=2709791 RepID=UPI0013EB46C2|nr:arsenosugar biosynthesis radical SAM (seleno)protein ArsS [Adlercreutzia sp. ZJ304]
MDKTVENVMEEFPSFIDMVPECDRSTNEQLTTMQVNVGYKCNLACRHCHLACGPQRTECMDRSVMQACLDAYEKGGFSAVDITGGAPEMHPDLEWFLRQWQARGVRPIVRTNLCILTDPEYSHFAQLYADVDATLFASLPYYSARNVDKIRGDGTFVASIEGLRKLNEVGYGEGGRPITLVYNPPTATLPPDQASMEAEYRRRLTADFGVSFTNLVAITNNPSGRFAEALNKKGNLESYMKRLIGAFNPATTASMMCRDQISVDWQGNLYDCDFNQALGIKTADGKTIFDLAKERPSTRPIQFANHCYGCTAGAGSSCGGETA